MSEPRRDAAGEPEDGPGALTYHGSRFPWWLTLLWLAFAIWGVVYALLYFVPDLTAWLARQG
jgi:hypothetical protein